MSFTSGFLLRPIFSTHPIDGVFKALGYAPLPKVAEQESSAPTSSTGKVNIDDLERMTSVGDLAAIQHGKIGKSCSEDKPPPIGIEVTVWADELAPRYDEKPWDYYKQQSDLCAKNPKWMSAENDVIVTFDDSSQVFLLGVPDRVSGFNIDERVKQLHPAKVIKTTEVY